MSISFQDAIHLAQIKLNIEQCFAVSCRLVPSRAIETPFGWLIPITVADFEFENTTLGGNLPFFVDRLNGDVCRASIIHMTFEDWLTRYALKCGYISEPCD